jgi:WD40 repeat protein
MVAGPTEVLVSVDGHEVLRRILLPGRHIFGSAPVSDICIEAAGISERHACLTVADDGVLLLEDLGSSAGTFLDGRLVRTPTHVGPNKAFQLGTALIRVRQIIATASESDEATGTEILPETALISASHYELGPENASAWRHLKLFVGHHRGASIAVAVGLLLISSLAAAFISRVLAERDRAVAERDREHDRANAEERAAELAKREAEDAAQKMREAVRLEAQHRKVADEQKSRADAEERAAELANKEAKDAAQKTRDAMLLEVQQRKVADEQKSRADAADARDVEHLHAASIADLATAEKFFDNQLEDQWPEGVAYLVRALNAWPENKAAAYRLYSAMATPDHQSWPQFLTEYHGNFAAVAVTPDGRQFVTAGWDTFGDPGMQIRDVRTGKPIGGLLKPTCHRLYFSRDGKRLLGVLGSAWVWDIESGKVICGPLQPNGNYCQDGRFSPDGAKICTIGGTGQLWDVATGKAVGGPMADDKGAISEAVFSPDGGRLVTFDFSDSVTAKLWDCSTGMQIGQSLSHPKWISDAAFSPDGKRLVTASSDGCARIWDATTGEAIGSPIFHGKGVVRAAKYNPDGTRLATAGDDKNVRFWDAVNAQPVGQPLVHDDAIHRLQFSADGSRIVTATGRASTVWDLTTNRPLSARYDPDRLPTNVNFTSDGTHIITNWLNKYASIWDLSAGRGGFMPFARHEGRVMNANYSPDGQRIASASLDGTVRIWDALSGRQVGVPLRHEGEVYLVSFSPDGKRIVTTAKDETARIWDVASGELLAKPLVDKESGISTAGFSSNGRWVVTIDGHSSFARLWDAQTGDSIGSRMESNGGGLTGVDVSPDGKLAVLVRRGLPSGPFQYHVLDLTTGQWFPPSTPPSRLGREVQIPYYELQFSADGKRLVSRRVGDSVAAWDVLTGNSVQAQPEDGFHESAYSSDSKLVAGWKDVRNVRILDAGSGRQISEPFGRVWNIAFSPIRPQAITSGDSAVRIWDLSMFYQDLVPVPQWTRDYALAAIGREFNTASSIQNSGVEKRFAVLKRDPPGDDAWARLARWMMLSDGERTLDPLSNLTCREVAIRERDFGSKESLESALRYDPAVPLARLLLAKFEEDPRRAAFLRDYDLKRIPEDATLWVRAVKALAEQHDMERAKQALEKLAALDAEKARPLEQELGL